MNPFLGSVNGCPPDPGGDPGGGPAPAAPAAPAGPRRLASGTPQQEAIWAALAAGPERHLLVEARAGTGKSSTAREGQHRQLAARPALAGRVRYAVFNAQMATEFRADCPAGVEVGTLHAFGYQALRAAFSSQVERNKSYLVLDETPEGRRLPRYLRRSVALLAAHAKNQGLCHDSPGVEDRLALLAEHHDVNAYGRKAWLVSAAAAVLRRSAEWVEVCDFDDMVWLPGLHQVAFPAVDVLYIDEAQDLNPAQHALLGPLAGAGRVVALGDRYQAIYAFRGADADSMPRLRERLGAASLPLTVTWRCPRSHVELARAYVPDLEAHPAAAAGEVGRAAPDEARAAWGPGHMVLCPTNAPLVQSALALIAARRRVVVRGRAVGEQLLAVLRGCGEHRTVGAAAAAVERWRGKELLRLAELDGVEDLVESVCDRAAGLQAVLAACASPGEAEGVIRELFSDHADPRSPDAVVLSTVHRAKGLEADTVWLLEAPRPAPKLPWQAQQQRNLRYVALTRSKRRLVFVETEGRDDVRDSEQ